MSTLLLYRTLPSMMSTFQSSSSSSSFPSHQVKRRFDDSERAADLSSSDDNAASSPPPRKRRQRTTESRSSGDEAASRVGGNFALPSQGGPGGTARGRKRDRESELNVDSSASDDDDNAYNDHHSTSNNTSPWGNTPSFPSTMLRPPKRVRRTLSDGFSQIGLAERAEQDAAYTVQEPGEVGPAVWVRHVESSEEDGVIVGDLSEEEKVGKDMAVGFWRGVQARESGEMMGEDSPSSSSSIHLPSSYYTNAPPSTRHLPPPDDAWRNQQRSIILYAPPPSFGQEVALSSSSRPPLPHHPSSGSSMQMDDDNDGPRYVERHPTPMPDWTSDGGRFEELPDDDETGGVSGLEVEMGGMDVD